jgi:glutamate-ammonia-ligase adenylyltransferase
MAQDLPPARQDGIDLKLGMGGLADIEFLIQGQLLVGGVNAGHERTQLRPSYNNPITSGGRFTAGRSVRRAVREFLKGFPQFSPGGAGSDEINSAFRTLRALDHRVRLHMNSNAGKLDARHFETMVLLGLWPPHFDGSSIETWQDVLRLRREVRGAFRRFCP